MLIDHFAITREDDAASSPGAAQLGGTSGSLSAVEPVGNVGGRPAPAPAAADRQLSALGLGEATIDRFVRDYLQMLEGRLVSIRRCLDDSDVEGARVAVLSLESSSKMLGGDTLAARLGELRRQLDLGPTAQRTALMTLVEAAAVTFRHDLEAAAPGS